LFAAAQKRFRGQPPQQVFRHGKDWVELWDADDFDPWEALRWETVRVIFYRQHTPDDTVIEANSISRPMRRKPGSRASFRGNSEAAGRCRWNATYWSKSVKFIRGWPIAPVTV